MRLRFHHFRGLLVRFPGLVILLRELVTLFHGLGIAATRRGIYRDFFPTRKNGRLWSCRGALAPTRVGRAFLDRELATVRLGHDVRGLFRHKLGRSWREMRRRRCRRADHRARRHGLGR